MFVCHPDTHTEDKDGIIPIQLVEIIDRQLLQVNKTSIYRFYHFGHLIVGKVHKGHLRRTGNPGPFKLQLLI